MHTAIFTLLIAWCAFIIYLIFRFFRVPSRITNHLEYGILSPADGIVSDITECIENEYFKDKRIQISIFMSIWDVHVNTYPISGEISYEKYHPGKHLIAFLPKASPKNEHYSIAVKNNYNEILFRQIAGFLARRIVSHPIVKTHVSQGDEVGIIKLGSRVDIFLPIDTLINVRIGDKVRSQKTIVAYFI